MTVKASSLDDVEQEVVGHLLKMADGKLEKEFQGFEEEEAADLLQKDLEAEAEMLNSGKTVFEPEPSSLPTTAKAEVLLKDGDAKLIVSQVVDEITPIIKSLCVTDRMLQIQVDRQYV